MVHNQAYSIAVLIDELRSDDVTVRLRSLEQLELIAQALGQATPTDKVTVTRADLDKLAQKKSS
jgi:hypothetical protein